MVAGSVLALLAAFYIELDNPDKGRSQDVAKYPSGLIFPDEKTR